MLIAGIPSPLPNPSSDSTLTFPHFHRLKLFSCVYFLYLILKAPSSRIVGPLYHWFPNKFTWTSILYTRMYYFWWEKVRSYQKAHILLVTSFVIPIIPQIPSLWSFLHSLVTLVMAWPQQIEYYSKLLAAEVEVTNTFLDLEDILTELTKTQRFWRTQWKKFSSLPINQYIPHVANRTISWAFQSAWYGWHATIHSHRFSFYFQLAWVRRVSLAVGVLGRLWKCRTWFNSKNGRGWERRCSRSKGWTNTDHNWEGTGGKQAGAPGTKQTLWQLLWPSVVPLWSKTL